MKKIILSSALGASTLLLLPAIICPNLSRSNKTLVNLNSSNKNLINDETKGGRIFKNYNPKYVFAFFNDNLKFKQESASSPMIAKIEFGYNIEYLNSVLYFTTMKYNYKAGATDFHDSKPAGSFAWFKNYASKTTGGAFTVLWNQEASWFQQMCSQYTNDWRTISQSDINKYFPGVSREKLDPRKPHEETDPVVEPKLFVGPLVKGSSEQNPAFNNYIGAEESVRSKEKPGLTLNKYSESEPSDMWPNANNILWIISEYKSIPAFNRNKEGIYSKANWEEYLSTLPTLKWSSYANGFGVDRYKKDGEVLRPDTTSTDKSKSLLGQMEELLCTNLPDDTIKLDIAPHATIEYATETINDTFSLKSPLYSASNPTKQAILTYAVPSTKVDDFKAWCQKDEPLKNIVFSIDTASSLHYFSPFYNDLFVCNFNEQESDLTTEQQAIWKQKWNQGDNPEYYIPSHQLYKTPDDWKTADPILGKNSSRPITTNLIPPYLVNYDIPKYHQIIRGETTSGTGIITIPKDGEYTSPFKIKAEYATITDADWQTLIGDKYSTFKDFNLTNFNTYLYSLTPSAIYNFFKTGTLDTQVYEADGTTVKYKMWGKIQVYENDSAIASDYVGARPFFIQYNKPAATLSSSVSRQVLDDDIRSNPSMYACQVVANGTLSFNFQPPEKYASGQVSERQSLNSGFLYNFASETLMKPTINKCTDTYEDLYNQPELFKSKRIQYKGERAQPTHLLESQIDRNEQMLDSSSNFYQFPTIFKESTLPEEYRSYNFDTEEKVKANAIENLIQIWPFISGKEIEGESEWLLKSDPSHCGIEVKYNKTQPEVIDWDYGKLGFKINYTDIDYQINDKYDKVETSPFYYSLARISTKTCEYTFSDWSIDPAPGIPCTWKVTDPEGGETTLATIVESTGVIKANTDGRSGIVKVTATDKTDPTRIASSTVEIRSTTKSISNSEPTDLNNNVDPLEIHTPKYLGQGDSSLCYARTPSQTTYVGDTVKTTFNLGSSFSESTIKYGLLYLNFETAESEYNQVLTGTDATSKALNEYFELEDPEGKFLEKDPETGLLSFKLFEIENSDPIDITFRLKKECLTKEGLTFGLFVYVKDPTSGEPKYLWSSSEGTLSILPTDNPITKSTDVWKTADATECFKKAGDSVTTTVRDIKNLYYDAHLSKELFEASHFEFAHEEEIYQLEKEYDASTDEYSLGVRDAEGKLDVWYVFKYQETYDEEKKNYTLTYTVTQKYTDTKYGKLRLVYPNTGTPSILSWEWYSGEPKQPGPTPPPGPEPEPTGGWTITKTIGIILAVSSATSLVLASVSLSKFKKAKNKKDEEELDKK